MLWIILGLSIGSVASIMYDGVKKKRVIYALKRSANTLATFVAVVWAFFFMLGSVNLIPPIIAWTVDTSHAWSATTFSVMRWLPLVFVLTVIYIVVKVIVTARVFKFNAQEQQWELERATKLRDKMPAIVKRFVSVELVTKL